MTASSELQIGLFLAERGADARERLVEQLIPLARELAERAGSDGITISNLRLAAVRTGLLPQSGEGRSLSFLGAVLPKAGLVPTSQRRRSDVAGSHANLHRVFVAPKWAR